jgi:putative DNA primase/helicase
MPVINMRDVLAKAAAADAVDGSEDQLALDFSHRHTDELRYCALWGKWLQWDETRWRPEPTLKAYDLARAVAHDYAKSLDDDKIGSAKTVNAVVQLARADRRHAAVTEQWDTDIWLLNTPSGTIELPKGLLRGHRLDDYITKITAAASGGACPQWKKFLLRIMGGDSNLDNAAPCNKTAQELVDYLQRVAGYCLTGSIREHALFFCYGTGANGKGVFINTLGGILRDYAAVAPMETFLASKHDRHPTDLAGLRGARLVTAQETTEGRRWDETKIKALTGGDPISARFMRQDFFTYTPEFKLLIAGNHKPGLRGVDEAITRRFNLIPFAVTIPKAERDPDLAEKLKAEWPGILQWMIEGCKACASNGLQPPKAVREATEAYLESENAIGRWLEEKCVLTDPNAFTSSVDLFASWKTWSEAAGDHAGNQRGFTQALEDRGFRRGRGWGTAGAGTGSRGFFGIRL